MFRFPDYIFLRNHALMMKRKERMAKADRKDVDGNPVSLHQLVLLEPDWACNKIRALEAEVEKERTLKEWARVDADELKAELEQCLAAHAELNDKCCALENEKLKSNGTPASPQSDRPSVTIDGEKYFIPIDVAALLQAVSEERDELKAQIKDLEG